MSYCRFENTLRDLQDCYRNWDDELEKGDYEDCARKEMLELCKRIVREYGED